ncbi:MAG: hypothetical protein QNJ51_03760, partial [Calothrix sp. MO_167.B12]|nr:hypothetical protein [Calothrix sp. MO_167.B12]
ISFPFVSELFQLLSLFLFLCVLCVFAVFYHSDAIGFDITSTADCQRTAFRGGDESFLFPYAD